MKTRKIKGVTVVERWKWTDQRKDEEEAAINNLLLPAADWERSRYTKLPEDRENSKKLGLREPRRGSFK